MCLSPPFSSSRSGGVPRELPRCAPPSMTLDTSMPVRERGSWQADHRQVSGRSQADTPCPSRGVGAHPRGVGARPRGVAGPRPRRRCPGPRRPCPRARTATPRLRAPCPRPGARCPRPRAPRPPRGIPANTPPAPALDLARGSASGQTHRRRARSRPPVGEADDPPGSRGEGPASRRGRCRTSSAARVAGDPIRFGASRGRSASSPRRCSSGKRAQQP